MYLNISPNKIGIDQQFGKELYILLILKLFTITFMNPKNEFMLIRVLLIKLSFLTQIWDYNQ